MTIRVIGVSLNSDGDQDIISWVDSLPPREISSSVREAIRKFMAGEDEYDRMIREIWKEVIGGRWRTVDVGVVMKGGLDEDTMMNLKGLGQ